MQDTIHRFTIRLWRRVKIIALLAALTGYTMAFVSWLLFLGFYLPFLIFIK